MIEGKLVGLRALERDDLPLAKAWRNLAHFRKHFREHRELNSLHQSAWFERISASPNDFMFLVVRLSDGVPLGVAGLVYVNWVLRSADVSLYIGHEERYIDDEGWAEEAATLLLRYGFENLNLHKAWTELYEFDAKKIALFEKLGFHRDGVLRDNCFEGGRYWHSFVYSCLRGELTPAEPRST